MKRDRLALPILLLLLTVLVPSAGVMWMMREAVRNERAATNQRLLDVYRLQLGQAAEKLRDSWRNHSSKFSGWVDEERLAGSFDKIVRFASVDSVAICDQRGAVLYPELERSPKSVDHEDDPRWEEARRLEFVEGELRKAAEVYGSMIPSGKVSREPGADRFLPSLAAFLGKARCLEKLGDQDGAIDVLGSVSAYAIQGTAKSHRCAAYIRILEIADKDSPEWKDAAKRIEGTLLDADKYALRSRDGRFLMKEYPLRSHERHFLMTEFERLTGQSGKFPTLDAESLAIKYVGQLKDGTAKLPSGLRATKTPGVWQHYEQDSKLVLLYRAETIRKNLLSFCESLPLPEGVAFKVAAPDETVDCLLDVSLGSKLGDWRLGLVTTEGNPFNESSKQRNAVYVWIAALTVAATCVSAWLLLAVLRRRMRLAQLKNDLVATVSHELKTPLASIRLLVDTLLQNDGRAADVKDQQQTTEYLQLISAENARLTRLVENFLTFSRMERGQHPFDFSTVDAGQLAEKAASVFLDHCPEASECLSVDIRETAQVSCDQDSMVTAIVNLLENAWKYGGDDKDIQLQVDSSGDHAQVRVSDKGQGLTPREVSRVFDRFYQVDQRVARTQGGCGLGLSIVRSIVEAHGGSVAVDSKLDVGSTFVIQLPRSE